MPTAFIFEIKGAKKDKIFSFLKGRFSVMGVPMDVIFSVFSEAYVRLLKSITSQFLSRYSKSYNNLTIKSCLKRTDRVGATKLYVPNTTLYVLSRIVLMNFVAFVVFKIKYNLVSMEIF